MKQNRILFCKNKCCPVVEVKDDKVMIGEDTEWAIMSKNQFEDFVEAAKDGKFDGIFESENDRTTDNQ